MKESGFTLFELIVVIVLIGILSTVGIIKYRDLKSYTAEETNTANAKAIEAAIIIYYSRQITKDTSYKLAAAVKAYNSNPGQFFNDRQVPHKSNGSHFSVSYTNGNLIVR